MPNSDRDSSPELSEEPYSPIEEEEEIEEEVEEEDEEEVEEEEEEEEEEEPEAIGEEEKGDGEEEEAEYERDDEEEEEEEEGEDEVGEEREEAENEEETKDTSENLDSEMHAEDLNLTSPIPERSEPVSSNNETTGDCIVGHFPSVRTQAAEDKDSDTILADVHPAIKETHISSGGKCSSELLGDQTEGDVSLEKKTSSEDPGSVRDFYLQPHGSSLFDSSPGDTISSENIALQVQDKELVDTSIMKSSSVVGKLNGVLGKEVSPLDRKTDLKTGEDPNMSSLRTAQRRPRSSSPSASPENSSKKPAITCSFYARGWCIKGSSCRFLHHKEGSKEDLPEPSGKGDISDGTGSGREAERLRISSSQERQDPSVTENSSKSPLQMQRALIRAYGGETQVPPHVHGGDELHRVDIPQVSRTLIQDEHKSPIGESPASDHMDDSRPASEHRLSMRYLHEEKLQRELLKREIFTDPSFSRESCLVKSSEHRYYSGGSSASSGLYNPFSDDKRPDGIAFGGHEGRLPSHGSYGLSGSLNSAFVSSYQPAPGLPFSSESLDIIKTMELEKASHGFRSATLPKISSPYSRPAVENGMLRNPRDISASFRQRMETEENSWEPSIPFRPSFHYVPPSSSSSGSQYDPLLDSIEPHNTGSILLQSSEKTISVNISDHSIKGDSLLYRSRIPEYNMERPLSSFSQPQEWRSDKSKVTDGLTRQTSLTPTPGHTKVGGNSSVPKGHSVPLVESANVNGTEHGSDLRYQVEKSKNTKESKVMKIFRAALVDLVKELVKPAWREGHLSKDAHKTVVKKAVEKVLSALQVHQIPSTTELINQYLSTSRPKILKLVEGYVEKYSKS